ncbi:LPS export ABC transporter periplasmic protein LptC [Vitiosangium sp. GDMCC 1.1324]|uniref:LPS export ABC transporter periplasmic protein LptC n=1 Tax=Vitiosangium sp. (strain GDMCC 1.1324) TaxID=2138576 RepID=UPI001E29A52E|nr:LPS export ABC transporter periplasmic protein LptC [Vitiosangium sp. GDMCC 1.1324]
MTRTVLLPSLLALLAACAPKQTPGEGSAPPAVVMHGVRLRSYEGSTLSMTGQAEQATYQRNGDITASQATLHILGKGPPAPQAPPRGTKPPARNKGEQVDVPPVGTMVRAKLMEGNLGTRQMVASGDVEVRSASGMVARTPRATYDGARQAAQGSEGVVVTGPDYRIQADAFSLSFPDERFTFEGSVRTVLGAAP